MEDRFVVRKAVEIILLASIVAALVLFFAFGVAVGSAGGFTGGSMMAWAHYYGNLLGGSFVGFIYWTILFVCLVAIMLVIWSLGGAFLEIIFPKWGIWRRGGDTKSDTKNDGSKPGRRKKMDPRDFFLAAARRSREMLLVIPAILFITIVALAMGEANAFAVARLQDAMVIGWEHALFGVYVFAALGGGAIHYPHWLITFIIFSFENMALILIGAGIVLSFVAREQFRKLLVAFCIGILAMVPIWLAVPVLSPQDRYIDNIYQLPISPPASASLAAAVADYHPQPEIAAFLQTIRTGKAGLPALPTSTFPSAHVFWAALAGWYLFQADANARKQGRKTWRRWLGWVALPFLLASTFGTVLLAQHYFMDVPVALVIAAGAIWLASSVAVY